MDKQEANNSEGWAKAVDLILDIKKHVSGLEGKVDGLQNSVNKIETQLQVYEAVMPKERLRDLSEEMLTIKQRIATLELEEKTRKRQAEAFDQIKNQQDFTWKHAIVMMVLTALMGIVGARLLNSYSDQPELEELKMEIRALKKETGG